MEHMEHKEHIDKKQTLSPRPPGEESWTDAQWQAIQQDGDNILVTAGAGAGKTRVLVKRLLEQISDADAPLAVDSLLVVTFTNAAAAEMRKRLAAALEEKIRRDPRATHLRRQLLLLNKAQISTVHSFCLEVIREYYHLIDLDPSFRMLDEGEALLLQQDLLEDLLEEYYAGQELDSPFYHLVESRSSVRGDQPLQDLILRLYRFSLSHPAPQAWLQEKAAAFHSPHQSEGGLQPWLKILQEDCRWELTKQIRLLQLALEITGRPTGPTPYRENIESELLMLDEALQATYNSWEELSRAVQQISFVRLKPCSKEAYDDTLRKKTTTLRDRCKKDLANLKEQLFSRTLEEQEAELQFLAPLMQILVELVLDFHQRYLSLKGERGVADFNDLEHFALQILRDPQSAPGQCLPSVAAQAYRERFDCVMVDEYQDINQLQESIITLVSRDEPGNMFMVGDVKQSIYRFRLAEPELFLQKLRGFNSGALPGDVIPLTYNFRSRCEVIDAVNYLFRQLMDENVGEVDYDHDAWLRYGAVYPENIKTGKLEGWKVGKAKDDESICADTVDNPYAAEMLLLSLTDPGEQGGSEVDEHETGVMESEEGGAAEGAPASEMGAEEEWELAALEGKLIARRIREMRGEGEGEPLIIYDKKAGEYRPPAYRDMVILLRSYKNCAPVILEELQRCGIPAYAELATGYFAATEVEVMLALLKVIDNPYQDISLAAVLRSPLVGLRGEELAQIRIAAPYAPYYEAVKAFVTSVGTAEVSDTDSGFGPLHEKMCSFLEALNCWQEQARQQSLGALIWQLYGDSGYYDMLGGMPGGKQRQANLRALYDRARQYEATSFRGLSRFLHFVERLRERGGDLGAARALGEQEDVVRILTVHKSKGLEFPVVFVAGLSRQFNLQELGRDFLLHKELGFGPKFIDTELRIIYPTLPWFALKKQLRLELLAEEMRILYVALTRAEQKLVLVTALRDMGAKVEQWEQQAREHDLLLPDFERGAARSFMDWLGPAMLRHPQAKLLRQLAREPQQLHIFSAEPSAWQMQIISAASLCAAETAFKETATSEIMKQLPELDRLEPVSTSLNWEKEIARRLEWSYPHRAATNHFAKLSVSTLQRLQNAGFQGVDGEKPHWSETYRLNVQSSPRFLAGTEPGVAERGTAYHIVMQCINLNRQLDEISIVQQLGEMVNREQLTSQERDMVDPRLIASFFQNPLGQRLIAALKTWRELPFTLTLPASQLFPDWQDAEEQVFVQGVIDCLFQEEDGLVLIDYKCIGNKGAAAEPPEKRYRSQLNYYAHAIQQIRKEPVKETYLYLINQEEVIKMSI